MAVRRKPHTFTLTAIAEQKTGNRVDVPTYGAGSAILCQITPETPRTVFDKWGMELEMPHLMLCEISDGSAIKIGDVGTYDSREFTVKGVKKWQAGNKTDHMEILLEQSQL
jgi:hypothetical protein